MLAVVPHVPYLVQVVREACMVGIQSGNNLGFPIDKIHTPKYGLYDMEILEYKRN